MLYQFLEGNVKVVDSVRDWEEALEIGAKPLLSNGCIDSCYIDAIIQNIYKNGPYVVLIDGIAMPHSRPEDGVKKKGMSLLKVIQGVDFYKTTAKVYVFFTLAAEDSDGHQDAIAELANFLDDEQNIHQIVNEYLTEEEILDLFKKSGVN